MMSPVGNRFKYRNVTNINDIYTESVNPHFHDSSDSSECQ